MGAEGRYLDLDQVAGKEQGGARNKEKLGFPAAGLTGTCSHRNLDDLLLPLPASFRKTSGNCWSGFGSSNSPPPPASSTAFLSYQRPAPDPQPQHTPGPLLSPGQAGGGDERPLEGRARDSIGGFHLLKDCRAEHTFNAYSFYASMF